MKALCTALALAVVAIVGFAGVAGAQYYFLDSNGNGIHDPGDVLGATDTTSVDVYLDATHNGDGSQALCPFGDGPFPEPDVFSFGYILHAVGGTVTYANAVNTSGFATSILLTNPISDTTDFATSYGSTASVVGKFRLTHLTIEVASGTPAIEFASSTALDANAFTVFGANCLSPSFDYTWIWGTDFFDADGLGPPAGTDLAPAVTAPATQSVNENAPLSFTVTASDPDGDAITSLTAAPLPTGATFTPNGTNTSGTFNWTPTFDQAGPYNVTFTATNALSGSAMTAITVNNVDRPPTVSAPASVSGDENTLITFTVTATDPDGDATSLTASGLPSGATFPPTTTGTGTFNWTPTFNQAGGPYNVTFTATNTLSGSAMTAITVNNVDRPPTVSAPGSVSGDENTLITFTVTATDPDGEATTLTASGLPSGATFPPTTTGSGTFNWTPTFNQAGGPYNVTFTATNTLSGSAMTAITVNNVDRAPTVTAPASQSGTTGALLTFTVTAADPDGETITSLTAAPLPTGATFTPNGANTSGTFDWTPGSTQAGSYSVTFTASNALSGTATTAITITSGDRAPVVTAPPTASGAENANLNFTVSATDPDGDPIASFTAAPLPAGATFTPNGSSTSGTFDWTPDFTQAGPYSVTFTASNALSGSATTAITIDNTDRAPEVSAPSTFTGFEGSLFSFGVTASDPDGEAISSLTAAPLPAGATFTPNGSNTSGSFEWTPGYDQAGPYTVTFTASNALTGTAATDITIENTDRPPMVTAPANQSGSVGMLLSFAVTAGDPDGDAITSLAAAPLPTGATFTPNGTNTSGTFEWTPTSGQEGTYDVTFTASNTLFGTAATHITIGAAPDQAPTVTAPATASGDENTLITFGVTANDPDGDAITSLTAAPLPAGATFTPNGTNTAGTFSWTPDYTQGGSTYPVTFTASNSLSGSATTDITVNNVDRAPTVTAPATAGGDENTLITFGVSASDPDGDAITSLTAAPLPAGATFTPNGTNTAGTFSWTPDYTQGGSTYPVTFTASNSLSGSATTDITVNNVDRAPTVTAPATASGTVGSPINFTVTAGDPDGDAITSLTAVPLPTGATFTPNGTNTSGTFDWTPDMTQAGSYSVTFTASNILSGSATTAIQVSGVNHPPVVTAPATESVDEGQMLSFGVLATDSDGDHVTLTASGVPTGASFMDNGDNTGSFTWTPGFTQSGSYTVTFTGSDGNGGTGTASTAITVNDKNREPTANAGGPYTGIVNVAISFNGSGSNDPDGDALSYLWSFGDGGSSTEVSPSHTYTSSAGSPYTVALTVSDGPLSDTDMTTATILDVFPATAFVVGGNKTTRLGAGKPFTCVQIEPVLGSFDVGNVIFSSIKMVSAGTGSVGEIFAAGGKTTIDGDKDRNGITEIVACFTKEDLRLLFDGLASGRHSVDVTVEGNLATGGAFQADLSLDVVVSGKALAAAASPNPFNPETSIRFATERPGTVRLQIFDLTGRLVTTLRNEAMPAGDHTVRWDGRTQNGGKVASGIYYFRLEADGQHFIQRLTVLK